MSWLELQAEIDAEFAELTNHAEQLEQKLFIKYQRKLAWHYEARAALTAELKARRAARPRWNPGKAPLNFVCECGERYGTPHALNQHIRGKHMRPQRKAA